MTQVRESCSLLLMDSWLRRILRVRYEDSISRILPRKRGVPQGSILGPVLLTIYVDDLTNEINNSQIKMYVDDCQLLF